MLGPHVIYIMSSIIFIVVIGAFLFNIAKGISTWSKNNNSPRLTVDAKVVTKRANTRRGNNQASATSYYVTFQFESGDRMEFKVNGSEYGLLVEGDFGKLSFQGSRYIRFDR